MRSLLGALAVAVAVAGCSDPGKGAGSPEAALMAFDKAYRSGDADAVWNLQTKAYQQATVKMLDELMATPDAEFQQQFGFPRSDLDGMTPRQKIAKLMHAENTMRDIASRPVPVVDRVEGDGKRATVYFSDGQGGSCRVQMADDNGWKMDGMVACKKQEVPGPPARPTGPGPGVIQPGQPAATDPLPPPDVVPANDDPSHAVRPPPPAPPAPMPAKQP